MTVARDRVIGILFGNLVVALVFTLIWPLSVARRIDPALATLLRRLGTMVSARSRPAQWALATEVQAALGAIETDIGLTRYEPRSIRPAPDWLERRREAAQTLAPLQGLLLIGTEQDLSASGTITLRLDRLADEFDPPCGPLKAFSRNETPTLHAELREERTVRGMITFIEAPLAKLEQVVAQPSISDEAGSGDYARV